jgi:broad specificity phosphatase PhoE
VPAATHLLLIRHAEAAVDGRLCGWFDPPLTPTGSRTLAALEARACLRGAPDALYTSPLHRAHEVALALSRAWYLPPIVVPDVREICCGLVDGMRLDELEARYPDLWTRNLAQDDEAFGWPDGESYGAFRARVVGSLDVIARRHAGGTVAVVTHAGVVSQVLGILRARSAAAWEADRPGLLTGTRVTWRDGAPRALLSYSAQEWC